ncbi:MAG: hypothetical protein PHC60_09890, partial [Heliobacteriaceae bacterium]|nr:hypothetical protein [Heliobacteriaceae bacterium]
MFKHTGTLALLTATIFALCLLLPVTALAGSSTYTAAKTGIAKPGGTFDARLMIEVPQGAMTGADPADGEGTFRVRLPKDTTVGGIAKDIPLTYDNGVDNQFAAAAIKEIKPDEFEFNVAKRAGATGKGLMYIDFTQIKVPSGHAGDFKVVFEAESTSVFSSGEVAIATVGAGTVNVAIDDVKSFGSHGGGIDTIRIKEDRPGALKAAGDSIKLKLPQGFKWDITGAAVDPVWGNTAFPGPNTNAALDAAADEGRSLKLRITGESNIAAYISISGLKIGVDESVAKTGDITVSVGGDSSTDPGSMVVGKYGNFAVKVEAFGKTPNRLSGRAGVKMMLLLEESLPGSLVEGRTITLTVPENTRWKPKNIGDPAKGIAAPPRINETNSDKNGAGIGEWVTVDSDFRTIKATVDKKSEKDPAKIIFEKGEISLAPNFKGDLEI